jgi:hypothetical protein
MTGRRTEPTRKASSLRSSSFSIEKSNKQEEELLDNCPESSSSSETSNKLRQNNGQVAWETIQLFTLSSLYTLCFLVLFCSTETSGWRCIWFSRVSVWHQYTWIHSNISLSHYYQCRHVSVVSVVSFNASHLFIWYPRLYWLQFTYILMLEILRGAE